MNKFNEKKKKRGKEKEKKTLFLNKLNSCFRSAATTKPKVITIKILFNFKYI